MNDNEREVRCGRVEGEVPGSGSKGEMWTKRRVFHALTSLINDSPEVGTQGEKNRRREGGSISGRRSTLSSLDEESMTNVVAWQERTTI